jgi:16S rRNA (guanine527-N7)-methyltransferase
MKGSAGPLELLRDGLAQLAIPDPDRAHSLLAAFLQELERWNPRFGLVKHRGLKELVVKHVLDSLSAWTAVRGAVGSPRGSVLDVGSGAGFPGIPLAVVLPDAGFVLLERMTRRAAFLRTCGVLLGLKEIRVLECGLGEVRGSFDVVTFRAVAPLDRFLSDIEKSDVRWRTVISYKGRLERARREIEDAQSTRKGLYAMEARPLSTPFLEEERCMIVVSRLHS